MKMEQKEIFIEIPKNRVKKNSVKHSKENALEKHEQEELIRAVSQIKSQDTTKLKYRILIALTMEAGLRISEAVQCRKEWLNHTEDGYTINIPKEDRDINNLKKFWQPKTEAGAREVIFLDANVGSMVNTYFITNPKGLEISRQRAGQIVKSLGKLINKPNLHPHALRSTYANNLVYQGVNTNTLTYYMGWSDLKTAQNYVKTSKIAARKDLKEKFSK